MLLGCVLLAAGLGSGCGGDELPPDRGGAADALKTPTPVVATPEIGSGHPKSLGFGQIGDMRVEAIQAEDVEADKEIRFDMLFHSSIPLNSLRAWIGDESATLSTVAIGTKTEPGKWHAMIKAPATVSKFSKLWIEVTRPSGAKVKGSLNIRLKSAPGEGFGG